MGPKLIVLFIVVVLALTILVQNSHPAKLRLLFWSVETSQLALILIMLAAGFVLGFVSAKLLGRPRAKPQEEEDLT